jgi:hypothetical protein
MLMPDHLHALIQVPERLKLSHVIASWKSCLTKNLGIRWQHGFFDHRIRRSESLSEKWNYIEMNPVRAGFVKKSEEWPYRWSPKGTDDRLGHPRTSETLVRTKLPALKLSALPRYG